jgi:hypothetical protein
MLLALPLLLVARPLHLRLLQLLLHLLLHLQQLAALDAKAHAENVGAQAASQQPLHQPLAQLLQHVRQARAAAAAPHAQPAARRALVVVRARPRAHERCRCLVRARGRRSRGGPEAHERLRAQRGELQLAGVDLHTTTHTARGACARLRRCVTHDARQR